MSGFAALKDRISSCSHSTLALAGVGACVVLGGVVYYLVGCGGEGGGSFKTFVAKNKTGTSIVVGKDIDLELVSTDDVAKFHTCTKESRAFKSYNLKSYVNNGLNTQVEGLEGVGVTFGDIFRRIQANGDHYTFVYGGYIRDLLNGKINDDIDCLFTCGVDVIESLCQKEDWTYYLKTQEKTGLKRISYIAIGRKKGKFSGHVKGRGCEGDFTMNTLLYETSTHTLVDPLGCGVEDAVNRVLRIPAKRGDGWDEWIASDRLKGMRLLRFFNFASRGYKPADIATTQYISANLLRLARDKPAVFRETSIVFLERKVLTGSLGKARVKERLFAETMVKYLHDAAVAVTSDSSPLIKSTLTGLDAGAWYARHIVPLYSMVKSSVEGMEEAAMEIASNYISS